MAEKAQIKAVFTANPEGKPSWPYINYDSGKKADEIIGMLREHVPGIELSESVVYSEKEAEDMVKKEEDRYDGYFIYRSGGMWTGAAQKIIETGQPVVMADDLYAGSGGFLKNYSYARKNNLPVVGIASSDFHDVINAVKLFEVLQKMKDSKVLVIQDRETGMGSNARAGSIKELFGTDILQMNSDELKSYYEKTDQKEAEIWKNKWIDEAVEVRGPSEEEILKSARMYLAVKQIMKEKKADAVTIDCLGLFYADRLTAYPCLAFFQLNNEGSTGVCEADLDSTITQLMMRYAAGIPGFVSDPVIDTSCSQIIYAHCVGTNRVYGPDDTANPYSIRTHAEDQKGAAIQSLMPIGEQVTTLKINVMEKAIAVHQGRTVANVNDEKGCRTKLAAEVDAETILNNWNAGYNFGWHRVTFYGDYKKQVINLARLLGLEIFNEDK